MTNPIPLAVFAVGLALAGAVQAQPFRQGSATLYDQPNFQGASVVITQSTPDLGKWRFNDRARSAKFEGRWLICEHDQFKGRCQEVSGAVPDLTPYRLMEQISSLEPAGRPGPPPGGGYPGGGGGYPGGPGGGGYPGGPGGGGGYPGGAPSRGVDGTATVFFARPTLGGVDVAAGDRGANAFCRRVGLGNAVWFDSDQRANQAVGPDGQFVGRSQVIRDLLCRKY